MRSVLADLILGLCAAILALTGAGFLLLTGYWALARALGSVPAAGLIGAGLLVLAALLLLISRERRLHRKALPRSAPVAAPVPTTGDPAIIAVFVLGFVLSRRFLQPR